MIHYVRCNRSWQTLARVSLAVDEFEEREREGEGKDNRGRKIFLLRDIGGYTVVYFLIFLREIIDRRSRREKCVSFSLVEEDIYIYIYIRDIVRS